MAEIFYLVDEMGYVLHGDGLLQPQRVPDLRNIKFVCASDEHVLFLDSDGIVWVSGDNAGGYLGVGHCSTVLGVERLTAVPPVGKPHKSTKSARNVTLK